mmetsp:Transcript_81633/g.143961  ORF Transcript_81633/g.143961 Transcript_81633/m.143961 type:complete len:291 (-) Transcript_81633:40-912(-)
MSILNYQLGLSEEDMYTETTISELDVLPIKYLFRTYPEMPPIEQWAMDLARGSVLDVGCGAGSHALYLQEERGLTVTALDNSLPCLETCRLRGVKNVVEADVFQFRDGTYDTILLLMNGAGICGKLKGVGQLLKCLEKMLAPNGQILLDSSDLIYMYDQDMDGGYLIPGDMEYYGEVEFTVHYKGKHDAPFKWVYVDYGSLSRAAQFHGFRCERVVQGDNFDYLARITRLSDVEARADNIKTFYVNPEDEEEDELVVMDDPSGMAERLLGEDGEDEDDEGDDDVGGRSGR